MRIERGAGTKLQRERKRQIQTDRQTDTQTEEVGD